MGHRAAVIGVGVVVAGAAAGVERAEIKTPWIRVSNRRSKPSPDMSRNLMWIRRM